MQGVRSDTARHCIWAALGGRRCFWEAQPCHMPGTRGGFLHFNSFDLLCLHGRITRCPSPRMIVGTMTGLVVGLAARPRPAQSDACPPYKAPSTTQRSAWASQHIALGSLIFLSCFRGSSCGACFRSFCRVLARLCLALLLSPAEEYQSGTRLGCSVPFHAAAAPHTCSDST